MIGEKGKLFRYNFRFSKEENDMLKTLSKKNKSSYSDVIRTALRIYFAMCMKNSWYFVHTNGCFVHTNDFLNCMHKLFFSDFVHTKRLLFFSLYIQNWWKNVICTYKMPLLCPFFDFKKWAEKKYLYIQNELVPTFLGFCPLLKTKVATKNLGKSKVCGLSAHLPTFFLLLIEKREILNNSLIIQFLKKFLRKKVGFWPRTI